MLEEIAGSLVRDLMRVNVFDSCCSGTLLMTDKAIDKPHQLIRERALYRRNLTLRTATARSHNPLKPYSNKLPVRRSAPVQYPLDGAGAIRTSENPPSRSLGE